MKQHDLWIHALNKGILSLVRPVKTIIKTFTILQAIVVELKQSNVNSDNIMTELENAQQLLSQNGGTMEQLAQAKIDSENVIQ